ncbi:MAG: hypothetical protein JRJ38_19400 [Deltaproteobacteria bacterium]|nr:hypothetical protein [Deltaproteobacteria bacterium]
MPPLSVSDARRYGYSALFALTKPTKPAVIRPRTRMSGRVPQQRDSSLGCRGNKGATAGTAKRAKKGMELTECKVSLVVETTLHTET